MDRITGKIEIDAVAIDPIHHGAGTSGNTQLLRMQDIVLEDGTPARVPFISGNSLKHMLREHGVRFAIDSMGVADGSLSKAVVDLLFSGGALSKTGSAVNLEKAREIARLFPILGVCGYSAGNFMQASKIRTNHLHLVCSENRWRIPERAAGHALAGKRAALYLSEEFGTRHEATRRPQTAALLAPANLTSMVKTKSSKQTQKNPDKGDSSQMIYEFATIKPGSRFWGCIHIADVTPMELTALKAGLSHACEGTHTDGGFLYSIGAKSSVGFGRVSMRFTGALRAGIRPPEEVESMSLARIGDVEPDLEEYVTHLRDNRDAIIGALEGAM